MAPALDIRPSPIAGQWYPADPRRLAESVDEYIHAAGSINIEGEIIAVMSPHAGHRYSGPVAGYAFAALQGLKPELVAVVSPMHYQYHEPLLTSAHEAYSTPLGSLMVDRQALDALELQLQASLGFGLAPIKNDPEHSLEIELPFLQRALQSEYRLLPVMVRDVSPRVTRALGKALAKTLSGRQALLVASTDFSHFYPQNVARNLDGEMLRRVETFDPAGLLKAEEEGKGFACGRGALAAVMWAAQELGANRAQVLNYATSGDVSGDLSQVVGYAAAVFYQQQ
ncbi:MAG: AmmeMemoRadiSam system protein B [Anaerolineales bacterium]|nr:MAG: AmmeMemoRadiSam system protein B [Anaerolineales bacterium]